MFLPFSVPPILIPLASANQVDLLFTPKKTLAIVILLYSSLSGNCYLYEQLSTPLSSLTPINPPQNNSTATSLPTSSPSTISPETSSPQTSSPQTSSPQTSSPQTSSPQTSSPQTTSPPISSPTTGHPTTIRQQTIAYSTRPQDKESKCESSSSPYIALGVLGPLLMLCVLSVLLKKHGKMQLGLGTAHKALRDSQCLRESEFNVTYDDVEKRQAHSVVRDSEGASPLFGGDDNITYAEVQFGRETLLESGDECPVGSDTNTTYATIKFFQPPKTFDQSKSVTDTVENNDNPCI
ncbi:cell wall protein RTB1-like [Callorhinchus milii]|uniref:cell wall protein RTB1-like n=1 Tax=Callorhinchus milii TaxID=7868 RepID=UPI00045739F4|nr:cell wall protein RTB1-like [Callorhinchus milii]|eukprot:gi/632963064/ref/XP_007897673.1/ PREDICTED: mucin-17-like [Callorhinchus milii]